MELKEVQDYLETNKGKKEVKSYLSGLQTPEGAKTFLESEDGKTYLQPRLDTHFTKSLQTWKDKHLTELYKIEVDKAIAKKYPTETEDQKRIRSLEDKLTKSDALNSRNKLRMDHEGIAKAKGLPAELVDFFVGADADSTKANMLKLETVWKAHEKTITDAIFKKFGRKIDKTNEPDPGLYTKAEVEAMDQETVNANLAKVQKSAAFW